MKSLPTKASVSQTHKENDIGYQVADLENLGTPSVFQTAILFVDITKRSTHKNSRFASSTDASKSKTSNLELLQLSCHENSGQKPSSWPPIPFFIRGSSSLFRLVYFMIEVPGPLDSHKMQKHAPIDGSAERLPEPLIVRVVSAS